MGTMVENQLNCALEALEKQDGDLAKQVLVGDEQIDNVDSCLQYHCLELISLQQPTTQDLRVIAGVQRVSRELERIGDYAVNIAEAALYLVDKGEYFKPLEDIPKMARQVSVMAQKSLRAFVNRDLALAKSVILADDAIDQIFHSLHDELIDYMKKGSRYVEQGSYFLLVARYLERVGDHSVNIAQCTGFVLTGERLTLRNSGR